MRKKLFSSDICEDVNFNRDVNKFSIIKAMQFIKRILKRFAIMEQGDEHPS